MAVDAFVAVPKGTWTKLVDNITTDVTVALMNDAEVFLKATASDSAPSSTSRVGAPLLAYGNGWSEAALAEKFPGVASAAYLWAYAPNNAVSFFISHA